MIGWLLGQLGVGRLLGKGTEEQVVTKILKLCAGITRANQLGMVEHSRNGLKRAAKRIGEHVLTHSVPSDDELKQMLKRR